MTIQKYDWVSNDTKLYANVWSDRLNAPEWMEMDCNYSAFIDNIKVLYCLTFTHSLTHSHTDGGVSRRQHGETQANDYEQLELTFLVLLGQ